jgi:hypothetical protein
VCVCELRDGNTCRYCGYAFLLCEGQPGSKTDRRSSLDHAIPQSAGGPNTLENVFVTCRNECNGIKDGWWFEDLRFPDTGLKSFLPQPSEIVGKCPFERPGGLAGEVQHCRRMNAQVMTCPHLRTAMSGHLRGPGFSAMGRVSNVVWLLAGAMCCASGGGSRGGAG